MPVSCACAHVRHPQLGPTLACQWQPGPSNTRSHMAHEWGTVRVGNAAAIGYGGIQYLQRGPTGQGREGRARSQPIPGMRGGPGWVGGRVDEWDIGDTAAAESASLRQDRKLDYGLVCPNVLCEKNMVSPSQSSRNNQIPRENNAWFLVKNICCLSKQN